MSGKKGQCSADRIGRYTSHLAQLTYCLPAQWARSWIDLAENGRRRRTAIFAVICYVACLQSTQWFAKVRALMFLCTQGYDPVCMVAFSYTDSAVEGLLCH